MMKLYHAILLLIILISTNLFATDRRVKIIQIINEEISEISAILNQDGNQPSLFFKKAELVLEKGRLQREIENEYFLKLPVHERTAANKKRILQKSTASFKEAQKIGLSITRNFPSYSYKGDIYFILAYYAKEIGEAQKSLKYFNQARVSGSQADIRTRAALAMAEMFYNDNKCHISEKLYKNALAQSDGKWKTKHLYNYAWCLYKRNKYDQAIIALEQSYRLSQKTGYIDMSESVRGDLIVFYVAASRFNDAFLFIKKSGDNEEQAISKILKNLKNDGKVNQGEKLLKNLIGSTKSDKRKVFYYLELFKIYDAIDWYKKSKVAKVLTYYKKLNKLEGEKLKKAQQDSFKMVTYLQKEIFFREKNNQKKKKLANSMNDFIEFNKNINSPQNAQLSLIMGESYLKSLEFSKAVFSYNQCFDEAEKSQNIKIQKKAMEGALSAASKYQASSKTLSKLYQRYLKINPQDSKSRLIYEKLFMIKIKNKESSQAEKYLNQYERFYPKQNKKYEALLLVLLDQLKAEGKNQSIIRIVNGAQKKQGKISKNSLKKINKLSHRLMEETIESLLKKGHWEKAIEIYKKILEQSPDRQSQVAISLNISQIYEDHERLKKSYSWGMKSLILMSHKMMNQYEKVMNRLGLSFFYGGFLQEGVELLTKSWSKSCQSLSLFKNSLVLNLALDRFQEAVMIFKRGKNCGIKKSILIDKSLLILNYLDQYKMFSEKKYFLSLLASYGISFKELSYYYYQLKDIRNSLIFLRKRFASNNASLKNNTKAIKYITQITKEFEKIKKVKISKVTEKLNRQIKKILNSLSIMGASIANISPESEIYIKSMYLLARSYQLSSMKIKKILKSIKEKELIESLSPVITVLETEGKKVVQDTLTVIGKYKNYSKFNHQFLKLRFFQLDPKQMVGEK